MLRLLICNISKQPILSDFIAEAILKSTHNICFYGELTKIIFQLSSNTHLICSTDHRMAT